MTMGTTLPFGAVDDSTPPGCWRRRPNQHGWSGVRRRWGPGPIRPEAVQARRGLRLDESAANGVAGELDAVAHPELLEDVCAMALHRLLADDQQRGDVVVRVGLGNQLDDLLLARGQRVLRGDLAAPGAFEVVANDGPDRRGIEERLAAPGGADRPCDGATGGRALHGTPPPRPPAPPTGA